MGILEYEKHPVKVAPAFLLSLIKFGKTDKSHIYIVIANLRMKHIVERNILDNLIAVFPEIRVKVEETERMDYRNVVVVRDFLPPALHFPFLGKVGYRHAEVEEAPLDKVLLILYLHFNNEPCPTGILALYVKHGTPVSPCFANLDGVYYFDILYWFFENSLEESVEEEQKEFRASLVGEGFFESEVQSKRSELRMFETGIDSRGFRHNPPVEKIRCNKNCSLGGEYRKTYEPGCEIFLNSPYGFL
jgi:hypothetical protein